MSVCWKFIFLVGQLAFTNFIDARTQNETSAHASGETYIEVNQHFKGQLCSHGNCLCRSLSFLISGYCRNRNVIRVGRSVMRFPSHTFYPADYPR